MKTKPVVRWPGGKTRLLGDLLPLIRPHTTYVEAFGGGLAVLLAKERSKCEIVNDINGELVALYRCAQFHLDALIGEIEWTLTSRSNLADFLAQPGLTEIQRAARFFLRNRMSFGGSGTSYAVAKATGQPSRLNVLEGLRALNVRLDKVSVENLSYERLMANYDSPETLWFFDPPYSAGAVDAYGMWSDEEMRGFATRVMALKGDWIVTVNDSPLNRELFGRHDVTPVVTRSGSVNRRLKPDATFGELIIRRRLSAAAGALRMSAAAQKKAA
jgi:DNA adenine methylase